MSYLLFSKGHERVVLVVLALVNMLLPMRLILKLNYLFAVFMARNPAHGFARNLVSMIRARHEEE